MVAKGIQQQGGRQTRRGDYYAAFRLDCAYILMLNDDRGNSSCETA